MNQKPPWVSRGYTETQSQALKDQMAYKENLKKKSNSSKKFVKVLKTFPSHLAIKQ